MDVDPDAIVTLAAFAALAGRGSFANAFGFNVAASNDAISVALAARRSLLSASNLFRCAVLPAT